MISNYKSLLRFLSFILSFFRSFIHSFILSFIQSFVHALVDFVESNTRYSEAGWLPGKDGIGSSAIFVVGAAADLVNTLGKVQQYTKIGLRYTKTH